MTTPPPPQEPGWPTSPPPGYGPPPPPYGQPQWSGSAEQAYEMKNAPTYGPYGQTSGWYAGGQAPQTDGTAIAVLVLAVSSFILLPVVPAIVALVLAPGAERDIAAAGGRLTGEGLVRAGRIVAWVHLGLCLAFVLVFVLVLVAFGAAAFNA